MRSARYAVILLILFLTTNPGLRAARAADDVPLANEIAKLEGNWIVQHFELSGKVVSPEELKRMQEQKFTFQGDKLRVGRREKADKEYSIKLDLTTKPRQMDIISAKGNRTRNRPAIYLLDGDTLKICQAPVDEERPKEFSSPVDSKLALMVLKRETANKVPAK